MSAAPRVGFVGAGKMASALAKGLCAAGFTSADRIVASDVSDESRALFTAASGARTTESNVAVATESDIVVLSVKPHHLRHVMAELNHHIEKRHLVVSIAAGVSLDTMASVLGQQKRLVRVMPNTPCLVGESASAFCTGGAATPEDAALVRELLSSVGLALQVPENLLDAVTGLSGSGPAYVYVMIEALSDGGVRMGLPRDIATKLAAQTLLGAARMVLDSGTHPEALKDAVASPGGTTIAGLHALEIGAIRGTLMNAVQAATLRARELG
jgi:pyrroline-5-carboxylate reductase